MRSPMPRVPIHILGEDAGLASRHARLARILWADFTRTKSPMALKARIQPWILDPLAVLSEPVIFTTQYPAAAASRVRLGSATPR